MTRIPPGVEIEAVTYVRVGRAEGGPCEGERVLEVRVRLSDGTTAACHWMCDDLTVSTPVENSTVLAAENCTP